MQTRTIVNGDPGGSVSLELCQQLVKMKGFTEVTPEEPGGSSWVNRVDVYLAAPRFVVPWALLGERAEGALQSTMVNKYRGHAVITRKSNLCGLLRGYPRHPASFVLYPSAMYQTAPEGEGRIQADKRRALAAKDLVERTRLRAEASGHFIVKDAQGAKGANITLCASVQEAENEVDSGRHSTAVVVQTYIREPWLLPGGRKFDMRVWVLLAPGYRVFVHRKGVCRTSSSPYDASNLRDTNCHITNHCIQEQAPNFGKFEEGNELFFDAFEPVLAGAGISFETVVLSQIHSIVAHVAEAAAETIGVAESLKAGGGCFQLTGWDFLMDAETNVHLLEVNGSPAIAEKLREEIVQDMIHILFPVDQEVGDTIGGYTKVLPR